MTDAKAMEIALKACDDFVEKTMDGYKNDSTKIILHKIIEHSLTEATASMFTLEDMETAWGYDGTDYCDFSEWITKYRKEKHGARSQSGNVEA